MLTAQRLDLYASTVALIAVSIFVGDASEVEAALARAVGAAERGAQLVEWRVDELAGSSGGHAAAAQLVEHSPLPSILTCRSVSQGGMFAGDEADRLELIAHVLSQPSRPRYLDLEFAPFQRLDADDRAKLIALLRSEHAETKLILSSHDFNGRPADLIRRVHAISAEPACDMVKIAWRARSLRDNLEAFELLRERSKPMIALCMGEFGLMSRVLQGKFGGLITYASDSHESETAPGQPTVDELARQFRFATIDQTTRVFGVIGWPVAQSLSPLVHNAGFEATSFPGVYLPLPVPPEWEHFKATLSTMLDSPALHFRGASVTMPHKLHLVRFVRERAGTIDAVSERSGAANTLIVHDDGSLEAVNTDAPAIIAALTDGLAGGAAALAGKTVAILGTGGTARAAAVVLADAGAKVVIISRDDARANECAKDLQRASSAAAIVAGRRGELDSKAVDVVINCTVPTEDAALPPSFAFRAGMTAFDVHYVPRETPFLIAARKAGARIIDGMALFLRQAAAQFKLWTGHDMAKQMADVGERAATN